MEHNCDDQSHARLTLLPSGLLCAFTTLMGGALTRSGTSKSSVGRGSWLQSAGASTSVCAHRWACQEQAAPHVRRPREGLPVGQPCLRITPAPQVCSSSVFWVGVTLCLCH